MTTRLLIAHGSPDPRHAAAVRRLAGAVAEPGHPCRSAFLDHDAPTLAAALEGIGGPVTSVALLLSLGLHAIVDVPRGLAGRGDVTHRGPLAVGEWLLPVIDDLVERSSRGWGCGVVVVAAGSRRPGALDGLVQATRSWRGRGRDLSVAVAGGPGPALAEAVTGPRGPLVVPLVVAPGVFSDRIEREAGRLGLPVTGVLTDSPRFAAAVRSRLAGGGGVDMSA